ERSSLLVTGDCFVARRPAFGAGKNAPRNDRGYVSFALNSGDFPLPTHAQHLLGRVLREGLLGAFTRNDN
ncbi:MAG: hypothetical protein KKC71_07700, partial [Chloroflexi bacterium]|nr:hypothetical protein [Chloroflexota bacterium]